MLKEQDFSIIRYLFQLIQKWHTTYFVYRFNGVGATSRCPECVVETISRWHNFAVVPEMITTREDRDSINHMSLAFEIGAKIYIYIYIYIVLTSVCSLDRKYLLET